MWDPEAGKCKGQKTYNVPYKLCSQREDSQETTCLLSRSTKRSGTFHLWRKWNVALFVHMSKKSFVHSMFCAGPQSTFYFLSHFCRLASPFFKSFFFFFFFGKLCTSYSKKNKIGTILPRRGFCLPNNPTDMLLSKALAVRECKILEKQSSTGVLETFF